MIDVQDHHLGRATGLAARLDRAGARVGAAHEAHRPARGSAAGEGLLRGPDLRQVDARARAALEDRALFDVPVQDRGHRVVDGQDEASGALLRRVGDPHVEPHGRVERGLLVHEQVAQLFGEDLRVVVGGEVGVLRPHPVIVSTTRETSWRTLDSRCGVPSGPRKYFCATMFVAFCDQPFGNSTSRCSNALPPSL